VTEAEVMPRVERRRKWTEAERAALLAEIDAEGSVSVVARRHGIAESLLYGWRTARKAKETADSVDEPVEFVPIGVFGRSVDEGPAMLAAPAKTQPTRSVPCMPPTSMGDRAGVIEIDLPNGTRMRVDAFVNERALRRVFSAMKDAL
jgi:transposase-like protein